MSQLNFIGIGAQKAGTTWLYDQLQQLEEFELSPIKELHYFDRNSEYISPDFVELTYLKDRLKNRRWYVRLLKDIVRTALNRKSLIDVLWVLKWHFSTYNDEAYKKMFNNWHDKAIKGEITPSYSLLNVKDIQRIYSLFPAIKIVFILRNPIDRAWSHCRFRKPSVMNSIESIKLFIDSEEQELRSDYLQTINNYYKVFPPEQFFLRFYDDIKENPKGVLKSIVTFLGGDPKKVNSLSNTKAMSNVSPSLRMPDEIKLYLLDKYKISIKLLATRFGGRASNWLAHYYSE